MATRTAEAIEALYRLPLDEFTAARNALAKRSGSDGAAIRALTKPPLAAWAVNQLYWKDRDQYEDLVRAAEEMRKAHKAVIQGKRGDLRSAGREHERATEAALKSTIGLLKAAGHPVTESTRQAILNTLRALPSTEPAGQLTKTLTPGGFEMLAGITAAPAPAARKGASKAAPAANEAARKAGPAKADREAARLREQKAAAEKAIRDADQRARQAEFEVARSRRDATKAERRLEQARQALEEAQAELADAEREAERALKTREKAEQGLEAAQEALERARSSELL